MAGLRELKSRLSSINTVSQLSGAMRTVSAAKYSRVSSVRGGFLPYAQACAEMMERFGSDLAAAMPCKNPEAPDCYVVMAGNRGLCGGYNVEILSYAGEILQTAERPYRLVVVGKKAEAALSEAGYPIDAVFSPGDVPTFEGCREMLSYLREAYAAGEISSLRLIHQRFINMLSRETVCQEVLPLGGDAPQEGPGTLFLPDRDTVLKNAALNCVDAVIYSAVLEAAAGAQAATLVAMRSAYDNAQESIADLETEISRRRQSDVTAGVLETASDNVGTR